MIIFMSIYMHLLLVWVKCRWWVCSARDFLYCCHLFWIYVKFYPLGVWKYLSSILFLFKSKIAIKPLEKEHRFLMTLVLIGLLKEMCCRENTMNQLHLWICLAYNKHFKCLMNFLTDFVQGGFSENAGTSYSRIWNLTLVVISIIH